MPPWRWRSPALADKKLDPDPAFLPKARTAATASVEPHYDLISDKVPFWARFLICAGQLTAARDEGRALPVPKDEIEKLIADYRARAADLIAYRQKADAKAAPLDADAEIAKVRSGAMQFLPADTTKLGVDHMKKLHGNRVTFCQLTRDWYEVQNGLRTAAAPAEQQKLQQGARARRCRRSPPRPQSRRQRSRRCRPRSSHRWCSRSRVRRRSRRCRPRRSSCRTPASPPGASTNATARSGSATAPRPPCTRSLRCARSGRRLPNAPDAWS